VQGGEAGAPANCDTPVAAEQEPISGLAGLATPATCEADHEAKIERRAIISTRRHKLVTLLAGAESRSLATTTTLSLPNTCTDCRHLLRRGTCSEPEGAGLIPAGAGFGLAWPPAGHGATCASYRSKITAPTQERPYSLTKAQGVTAHADAWDDAAMARFEAPVAHIQQRGFAGQDAEDLVSLLDPCAGLAARAEAAA